MRENIHHYTSVKFKNFKAFKDFRLVLKNVNILVGPNNSGKSTILAAFRILAAALRKANARNPESVMGPNGPTIGYNVDIAKISIAEENIYYNYDATEAAVVEFKLNTGYTLFLYFPEPGICTLIPNASGEIIRNTLGFKRHFKCRIGFVPILGPVDHNEILYEDEAAYNAIYNYRAARNFRNIWHHFPEKFEEFRNALRQTWPGMDIGLPETSVVDKKRLIHMFFTENRIAREIFWSGFGFQIWCQMLTHVIQNKEVSIFLIDEPDIYLHAELQRQLLNLLKTLGPDILIATHSTEMLSEADTNEIILINKENDGGRRVKDLSQIDRIFSVLGSSLNLTITQLAKTRKVVFVEGKDFRVITQFGRKLRYDDIGSKRGFVYIEIEGFNPDRIQMLKLGMEKTLGAKIAAAAVLDRDYRPDEEINEVIDTCSEFCEVVYVHKCKEIENYLLNPNVIDRAALSRINDRAARSGDKMQYCFDAAALIDRFCEQNKSFIAGQLSDFRNKFFRKTQPGLSMSSIAAQAYADLETKWNDPIERLQTIPGKKALAAVNQSLDDRYGINLTPSMIVEAMSTAEVPDGIRELVGVLQKFIEARV